MSKVLFFFIFQNTKKHLYIYTYTHVRKKKKKKKNNSFVAVFRRLVATLISVAKRMRSVFSLWSGGPFLTFVGGGTFLAFGVAAHFSNARSKPKNEGVACARTHTQPQPCPFSCVLARFLFSFDKLHVRAKKTQQTRNYA